MKQNVALKQAFAFLLWLHKQILIPLVVVFGFCCFWLLLSIPARWTVLTKKVVYFNGDFGVIISEIIAALCHFTRFRLICCCFYTLFCCCSPCVPQFLNIYDFNASCWKFVAANGWAHEHMLRIRHGARSDFWLFMATQFRCSNGCLNAFALLWLFLIFHSFFSPFLCTPLCAASASGFCAYSCWCVCTTFVFCIFNCFIKLLI